MENKATKFLPIAVSVIGLLIAGYGSFRQGQGGGSTLVWVGVGIIFIGALLLAAAAQKPKD
jgi:hypothetical protein